MLSGISPRPTPPPLLEQMRGWGRPGLGSSQSRPLWDLGPVRGGAGDRAGRKPHWPVGPRLHLPPHRVSSLHLAHSHSHTNTTALLWVGEDASQRRRGCRRESAVRNPVRDLAPPGSGSLSGDRGVVSGTG